MKKPLIILGLIAIISLVGFSFLSTQSGPNPNNNNIEKDPITADQNVNDSGKELYIDPEFGYSILLPDGFKIEDEGEYSKLLLPDKEPAGMGPANFIYISVVTPENKEKIGEIYNYDPKQFEKLIALENIGDSVNLADVNLPQMEEWFTYTVVAVEDIDQGKAKNFENTKPWEFPGGTTENRFIYGTEKNIYILGYYTGGDGVSEELRVDPRVAYGVIKSFKVSR